MSVAITSHTSGLSLTAQQPINNVVRGAVQALSLVLAGVQALEISAFDEAYRTPSKDAHIVGLRTQQILDLESGVAKVLDPLGGSYFVEALTDELEARIRARIEEIEAMGDPEALSAPAVFREIFHQAMEDRQLGVEKGRRAGGRRQRRIASPPEEDDKLLREVATSKIEPGIDHARVIERFKRERDVAALRQRLDEVAAAAAGSANLVPARDHSARCISDDRRDRHHNAVGAGNAAGHFRPPPAQREHGGPACRVKLLRSLSWGLISTRTGRSPSPASYARRK